MFFCDKVADTRKGLLVSNQISSPNPDNSFWTMKVSVVNEYLKISRRREDIARHRFTKGYFRAAMAAHGPPKMQSKATRHADLVLES